MRETPIFKQANHAQTIERFSADKPKNKHGKAWHSSNNEEREICLECPLEECTGGGRHCPLTLKKKGKNKR